MEIDNGQSAEASAITHRHYQLPISLALPIAD